MKTQLIRIRYLVNSKGDYNACGYTDMDPVDVDDTLSDGMPMQDTTLGEQFGWIEARVPLPDDDAVTQGVVLGDDPELELPTCQT